MRFLSLLLALCFSSYMEAAPIVGAVSVNANPVGQYNKFELSFPVTTWATNLYDPAQIDVHVTFSGPGGQSFVINAFPYQAYTRTGSKSGQTLTSDGALQWKCRFAPPSTGAWTYSLAAIDTGGTTAAITGGFNVISSASHGFVHVSPNDSHYFNRSDGSAVFPVGENFAWADSKDDNTYYYDDHLGKLAAQGGNLVRVWMASWSFGIEGSDTGLGDYGKRQDRAWALDYVLDQLDQKGMLAELCLDNHIPYSASNGWNDNPYNAALGGPLSAPDQIWTNTTAQVYMSRRLRYVTARWGYSTAVMAYEFWNEIENTDNYAAHWTDIANWHATNAAVIRAASPQQHPLSTSFGYYINGQEQVWPKVDFTQFHQYNAQDMAGMMRDRVPQMRGYKEAPTLAGEFGTDWDWTHASLLTNDTPGWNLHCANWGSLMTGAGAGPMTWWWDNLVEGQNQYPRYKGVSAFVAGEDLDRHHYVPQAPAPQSTGGAPLRCFELNGGDRVLGWVQNSNSEWYARTQNWGINTSTGVWLTINGLSSNGTWTLQWWDSVTGTLAQTQSLTVSGGNAVLFVPQLDSGHPDWAFKLFPAGTAPTPAPSAIPTATLAYTSQPTATPVAGPGCKVLLAYYPYWNADYRAAQIPFGKVTHINHAFAAPQSNGTVTTPGGYLEPALISGSHAAGVKVMASIGGADSNSDAAFRAIAANPSLRTTFANSLEAFCRSNGYDGVDIDWEFPISSSDRANLTAMITAIRAKFSASAAPAPAWLISMAVPPLDYTGQFIDYSALSASVNYFNIMGYDSYGAWSSYAGHNAALTRGSDPGDLSDKAALDYMLNTRAIAPGKVLLGLPFYGYQWANTSALYQACNGCPNAQVAYKDIAPLVGTGWTRIWDAGSQVPYLLKNPGPGFISYDDPQSIALKTQYAAARGVAGTFMWDLSQDRINGAQPLLDAMVQNQLCGTPMPTATPVIQAVPGRVQAEDYTAYYDTTPGNQFGQYRADDVDIETCTDTGGGYSIGAIDNGEWLEYQVQVAATGTYTAAFRVASQAAGPFSVQLQLDGANLGTALSFAGTGGWQTWATATLAGLNLRVGRHRLRVLIPVGLFNLNYVDFALQLPPTAMPSSTLTATTTPTATASPTATATATRTAMNTLTVTNTATATSTAVPTADPTAVATSLPTAAPTAIATAIPTLVPTTIPTAVATASPTATGTLTSVPTALPTRVPPTVTAVPTKVPTLRPTATVMVSSSLRIIQALPVPNPNPTIFYVQLSDFADAIDLAIYSSSNVLVARQTSGPHNLGWTIVYLPQSFLSSAGNGTYYYSLVARSGSARQSAAVKGSLAVYR